MTILRRFGLAVLATAAAAASIPAPAGAAGALAAGECDRHGFSFGYASERQAHARALAECRANGDGSCQVVLTLHGVCGAFVVSGECGARGWAYASTRRGAERLALDICAGYGGRNCSVRAWVCDGG